MAGVACAVTALTVGVTAAPELASAVVFGSVASVKPGEQVSRADGVPVHVS